MLINYITVTFVEIKSEYSNDYYVRFYDQPEHESVQCEPNEPIEILLS